MNNRFMRSEMLLGALVAVLCGYFLLPVLFWKWLVYELEEGSFPVNGDSIGIPFAGFMLVWFVGLIVLGVIGIVLRLKCRSVTT